MNLIKFRTIMVILSYVHLVKIIKNKLNKNIIFIIFKQF